MADKVIQFPGIRSWNIKKIEELIDSKLTHDNPKVLNCLKEEIKNLVLKYYDDKEIVFKIPLPVGLTGEQARTIEESFHHAFTEYHEELRKQTHAIFTHWKKNRSLKSNHPLPSPAQPRPLQNSIVQTSACNLTTIRYLILSATYVDVII